MKAVTGNVQRSAVGSTIHHQAAIHEAGESDPGNGGSPLDHLLVSRSPLLARPPGHVRVQAHLKNILRSEAELDSVQVAQGSDEEARSGHQRQGQRDLRRDDSLAELKPLPGSARLDSLQVSANVSASGAQSGSKAEENSGCNRHRKREGNHARVGGHFQQGRRAARSGRQHADQQTTGPQGHHQSEGSTEEGQQRRFGEQLPNQPPAAGADRQTHGHLLLPRIAACQQQVGDVRAGDQQHDADQRQQHLQRLREAVTQAGDSPAPGSSTTAPPRGFFFAR